MLLPTKYGQVLSMIHFTMLFIVANLLLVLSITIIF